MHIPAMDSLRHERVGIVSEGDALMVVQAHVKTEDTDERGAYDPVEGMARPFPWLVSPRSPTVFESVVEGGELEPFSDSLIEFASLLYDSAQEGEWVDELEEYDMESLGENEQRVAQSLQSCVAHECPAPVWRMVMEGASELGESSRVLDSNPLRDIEGRERYNHSYLPARGDVDEWSLKWAKESDEEDEWVAESLWLRYQMGDTEEERPLIGCHTGPIALVACSPEVEFGEGMDDAPAGLVEAILDGESFDESITSPVTESQLVGSRTQDYLEAYLER